MKSILVAEDQTVTRDFLATNLRNAGKSHAPEQA